MASDQVWRRAEGSNDEKYDWSLWMNRQLAT
jgi:hypothetical protein